MERSVGPDHYRAIADLPATGPGPTRAYHPEVVMHSRNSEPSTLRPRPYSYLPLLTALVVLATPSGGRTEPAEKITIELRGARVEDAVTQTVKAAGKRLSILVDSYDADETRLSMERVTDTPERIVERLAGASRRALIRQGSTFLLRHSRWFDPAFYRHPAGGQKRARAPVIERESRNATSGERFRVTCERASMRDLAVELSRITGEPHRVDPGCAERRVSGTLVGVALDDLRKSIVALYPGLEWRTVGWIRLLAPTATADFVQGIAAEAAKHDDAEFNVKGALFIQAAAELSPDQVAEFRRTGQLQIGWSSLSGRTRQLVSDWLAVHRRINDRSGTPGEYRVDESRIGDLGVSFRQYPNRIVMQTMGRTSNGVLVLF